MVGYEKQSTYRGIDYKIFVSKYRQNVDERYTYELSIENLQIYISNEYHILGDSYEILELIQKFEAKFKQLVDNYVSSFDTIMT